MENSWKKSIDKTNFDLFTSPKNFQGVKMCMLGLAYIISQHALVAMGELLDSEILNLVDDRQHNFTSEFIL